jgi:hypothetical protein
MELSGFRQHARRRTKSQKASNSFTFKNQFISTSTFAMEDLRKIALFTTGVILFLIVAVSILVAANLTFMELPQAPELNPGGNVEAQNAKAKEIANYKDLISSMQMRPVAILDHVIIKTLLPLFGYLIASVLTYIFSNTILEAYKSHLREKNKST